ncbi:RNA polymerase sigma factor [Nocardia harenae]|uniref:RNA polymerase sigma factor n=1 Tax=Nocardia harenae TaxID=358707 RepID=UPI00082EA55C|nr:sigma-70 family RNA polymerase sigma factor [Nocardia harenae]
MTGWTGRFDAIYRAEFGRSVAVLAGDTGDLGVAEDAVQEAFTRALRRWPERGIPDRPGAWITTVARRVAVDRLRRESARPGKEHEAVRLAAATVPDPWDGPAPAASAPVDSVPDVWVPDGCAPDVWAPDGCAPDTSAPDDSAPDVSAPVDSAPVDSAPDVSGPDDSAPPIVAPAQATPIAVSSHAGSCSTPGATPRDPLADDRLRLLFACAHPALAIEARVALILRLVCGLRTTEIARAFVVPEPTVAQRISRAKAKIRRARIPLELPPEHRLPERVPAVLAVIYLVFSEGYFATAGPDAVRDDLCDEAIRLGALTCALPGGPAEAAANALQALMLLQDSRRPARRAPDGGLVPLERQDRTAWNAARITAGLHHLRAAAGTHSPYLPQAEIAAAHATAPSWPETDWHRIVTAYDAITAAGAAAPVLVNRAIAIGFRDGPQAGLTELDAIAEHPRLSGTHLLTAAYADAYRRAARYEEAAAHYRAAIPTAPTEPVRAFLRTRLTEVRRRLPPT